MISQIEKLLRIFTYFISFNASTTACSWNALSMYFKKIRFWILYYVENHVSRSAVRILTIQIMK